MPTKHKIYFVLAAIHILMIALFTTHFTGWANMDNKFLKTIATIGNYSGSNNIFSFFAPGLSDQPYVIYVTKNKKGEENVIDFKGRSPEFAKRINNIYGYLTLSESRPVISASLAQFVLQRYPDAEKIRVSMVVQQIPDMEQYRQGERNHWQFWFYRDYMRDTTSLTSLK